MNKQPIGVFDSGLGGLTAVKELRRLLPQEDIVYFGDTARVPYGTRGRETIIEYAKQDIAFLLTKNVKMLVAACGTVSSVLPVDLAATLPVPYSGVVQAAARAAAALTRSGRVGVIGTGATIASGSYKNALQLLRPDVTCTQAACPLFVPLVENGHFASGDPLAALAAKMYLDPLKKAGIDTLILGCTHYPLLQATIAEEMGKDLALVNPGAEVAKELYEVLQKLPVMQNRAAAGKTKFFVSDDEKRFERLGSIFLGEETGAATRVDIEKYHLGT